MSVVCDVISVIVRISTLEEKYPGGFEAYGRAAPATFCSDEHLTRVGFVSAEEVSAFVEGLEEKGLIFFDGTECVDIAVVDQFAGATAPVPGLEFSFPFDWNVYLVALIGTDSMQPVYLPPRWDLDVAKSNKRVDEDGSTTSAIRWPRRRGWLSMRCEAPTPM